MTRTPPKKLGPPASQGVFGTIAADSRARLAERLVEQYGEDDARLLVRVNLGDRAAEAEFVRLLSADWNTYGNHLVTLFSSECISYAERRLPYGRKHDAEDLVSGVLWEFMYRHARTFDSSKGRLRSYIFTAVRWAVWGAARSDADLRYAENVYRKEKRTVDEGLSIVEKIMDVRDAILKQSPETQLVVDCWWRMVLGVISRDDALRELGWTRHKFEKERERASKILGVVLDGYDEGAE